MQKGFCAQEGHTRSCSVSKSSETCVNQVNLGNNISLYEYHKGGEKRKRICEHPNGETASFLEHKASGLNL